MWAGASHFALQLLPRLVSGILNKGSNLFKKLFNRQQKRSIRLIRERTVTVRDEITVELTGDVAFGMAWNPPSNGEEVKQLVKSLSDAKWP
jgi:hypothetical protein